MNKDNILNQITEVDIMLKFLELSTLPKGNISSPFSEDKNASFKLYKNGTFKCHSTGKQGDCFQLVAYLNDLDCKNEFNKVLDIIAKKCLTNSTVNTVKPAVKIKENTPTPTANKHFKYTAKEFLSIHYSYWLQGNWNVTKTILQKYNVQALDKFEYWNSKKNEVTKIKLFQGVLGFVYPVNKNVELYIPKQNKVAKFFYNQLQPNDIFGLEQISIHNTKISNLIITAGKKDCLILNANGFNAVTFRSENHYITDEQIAQLKSKCDNLFICYDNDTPGQTAQAKIAGKYKLISLHLPNEYNDIADYFKVYAKDDFSNIINETLEAKNDADNYDDKRTIFHITEDYLSKFYKFRYNTIALEIECRKRGAAKWEALNENSLFIELQKRGIKISINNLLAILKSDFVEHYNPLVEYFTTLPKWDNKTDYIAKLCSYVKVKDKEQFIYHFRKWCVRTVKCVFQEEYFNKQAFVLVHKGQSSGKSTWCRFLCPPVLSKYIAEDISNDKDARILLCKNFLINLDELAVLSRKEINSLKSYFSKTVVNERLPYDRKNSILPRVCSFIGSTNMSSFLNDETGSVRWLCFELTGQIDFKYSTEININQVWAQAYALSQSNFDCELNLEDIKANEERNSRFAMLSTEQEMISKYFEHPTHHDSGEFMTATDVMVHLQPKGIRLNKVQIGKALIALGYDKVKNSERGVYGYYIKPLPLFPIQPLPFSHHSVNNSSVSGSDTKQMVTQSNLKLQ